MEFNVNDYVSGFVRNLIVSVTDACDPEVAIGQLKYPQLWPVLERGDVEVWVDCVNYVGYYDITNTGKVRSKHKKNAGNILRQVTNGYGYKRLTLCTNGEKPKQQFVHRLVRYSFYDNPDPIYLKTVEHDDDDPSNNNLNNLLFASMKYQNQHCNKKPNPKSNGHKESRVVHMLDLSDGHTVIMTHASMTGAAQWLRQYGWPSAAASKISECARGKVAKMYGYKWCFVEVQDLPGEVWKPVPPDVITRDRDGPYLASTEGRIQNKHGKLIPGNMNGKYLCLNNISWNRIIAFTFCHNDAPDTKTIVKHRNNLKTDNRAANLEWDTQQKNIEEAHKDGLIDYTNVSQKVKVTNTETGKERIFDSIKQASQAHNVTSGVMIRRIDNGNPLPNSPYRFERID